MERKVTVQKLLFIAQNDQTIKSNGRPANESTNQSAANHQNEVEMNADESLRLNDSQPAKANLSTKSSHEVDMSVDDSLVLNDIRNIFETSTSSSEFIITKPLKSEFWPPKWGICGCSDEPVDHQLVANLTNHIFAFRSPSCRRSSLPIVNRNSSFISIINRRPSSITPGQLTVTTTTEQRSRHRND